MDASDSTRIRERIGPYVTLEVLGEGGFGIVYLAERRDPFVQRVAVKLIKPGMDSKYVLARFDQERQALAVMDHPNVARVLDGGLTPKEEGSRPYFVMEYVKGESITRYCDLHRLGLRERLELMILVCEAVQHAHHKGIIHRDLKPSNVLVTIIEGRATPKVIDFGVAKALSHTLTQQSLYTEQGKLIGTPEYMSPEQAEMGATDVDTRTDVYSLGVLLYELLSGTLPFEARTLRSAAHDEVRRIIREQEPPRPSTRLTALDNDTAALFAQRRHIEREEWTRTLRRELEWIPLKAIRKDRARRYATPMALAQDIRDYLDNKPIEAAPESRLYLVRKLMDRNKALLAACAAVMLALLIGGVGMAYFAAKWRTQLQETTLLAQRESLARKVADERAEEISKQLERQDRLARIVEMFGDAHAEFGYLLYGEDDSAETPTWDTLKELLDGGTLRDLPKSEVAIRMSLAQVIVDEWMSGDDSEELYSDIAEAIDLLRPALEIATAQLGETSVTTLGVVSLLRSALIMELYGGDEEDLETSASEREIFELAERQCRATLDATGRYQAPIDILYAVLDLFDECEIDVTDEVAFDVIEGWIVEVRENWHPDAAAATEADQDPELVAYTRFVNTIGGLSTYYVEYDDPNLDKDHIASLHARGERWRKHALAMGWQPPPPIAPPTTTPSVQPVPNQSPVQPRQRRQAVSGGSCVPAAHILACRSR